jgi:NADPH:quinone reductase-like Zn-dependent oxidoreductase
MKAFTLTSFDAPPALDDIPAPSTGAGEILVRVRTSSVNPVDNAMAAGMLSGMLEHRFPVILGRDFAGVVEEVGAGVTRYAAGDEVHGFLPLGHPDVHDGGWAELIVVPEDDFVTRKPAGLDFEAAGVAPLAGVTAMEAVDALELSGGDTVLMIGATGGVGSFAVQLAARAGATVIASALPEDHAYLRDLGVSELVDRGGDVAAAVRERHPDGVDALLDLVTYTPDDFEAHAAALRPGGRGASPVRAAGEGPGRTNVMSVPTVENLDRLGRLLADGTLKVPIQARYDLAQAGEGMQALASTHTQGKLAVRIS